MRRSKTCLCSGDATVGISPRLPTMPAGEHERAGEGILVADRVQRAVKGAEQRHLLAADQRRDAALGLQVAVAADRRPAGSR